MKILQHAKLDNTYKRSNMCRLLLKDNNGITGINSDSRLELTESVNQVLFTNEEIVVLENILKSYKCDYNKKHQMVDLNTKRRTDITISNLLSAVSNHSKMVIEDPFSIRVTEIVEKNLSSKDFNIDQLVKAMNTTRSTLFRNTKKQFNCTPRALLKNKRLERALMMLQDYNGTISKIAHAVGFNSLSSFGRAFNKKYGVPPSRFNRINIQIPSCNSIEKNEQD